MLDDGMGTNQATCSTKLNRILVGQVGDDAYFVGQTKEEPYGSFVTDILYGGTIHLTVLL